MAESAPVGLTATIVASVIRRRRVLLAGFVLLGLAWGGAQAWQVARSSIRNDARFQLSAESIEVTSHPAWVHTDVRQQAVARAAMQGPLSVLDPLQLNPRIAEAFRLEPWVKQVRGVQLLPSRRVRVDLDWRKPFAAVEYSVGERVRLLLLDAEAVRLPEEELAQGELRRLPRIRAIYAAPREGEAWSDRQVQGAVSLISRLGIEWERLALADVTPSARPEIRGDLQFYRYDLTTIGGTQIVWGAGPLVQAPDEAPFEQKLAVLKQFVAINGVELATHRSPQTIDLRYGIEAKRRIAKKKGENRTAQKDEHGEEKPELVK